MSVETTVSKQLDNNFVQVDITSKNGDIVKVVIE